MFHPLDFSQTDNPIWGSLVHPDIALCLITSILDVDILKAITTEHSALPSTRLLPVPPTLAFMDPRELSEC